MSDDTINYQTRPHRWRVSRTATLILLVCSLLMIGCWAYLAYFAYQKEIAELKLSFQLRSAKGECERYLRPSDEVVFQAWYSSDFSLPPYQHKLRTTARFDSRYNPIDAPCWKTLMAHARPQNYQLGTAPFFPHLRQTPSGTQRLIWVGVNYEGNGEVGVTDVEYIIHPKKLSVAIKFDVWCYTVPATTGPFRSTWPLTLYAGQPDPSDPTAFTLRYDLGGEPREQIRRHSEEYALLARKTQGEFRARLRDDDTLALKPSTRMREVLPSRFPTSRLASTAPASPPATASNTR